MDYLEDLSAGEFELLISGKCELWDECQYYSEGDGACQNPDFRCELRESIFETGIRKSRWNKDLANPLIDNTLKQELKLKLFG